MIHATTSPGACARPWGRGRWFGPLHMCDELPYHQGPCRCECGAEAPAREPLYWTGVPQGTHTEES